MFDFHGNRSIGKHAIMHGFYELRKALSILEPTLLQTIKWCFQVRLDPLKKSAQTFWELYWVYPYSLLRYLKPMEWWRFTIIKINIATPQVPSCLTTRALSRIACRALGVHLPWSAKCLRCWGLMFYLKFLSDNNHMTTTDSSQHCQPVEDKISCDIDSDICSCLFFWIWVNLVIYSPTPS